MTHTNTDLLAVLHALLDQALDLPPAEREAWLAQLRVEQPGHAAELEALLAAEAGLDAKGDGDRLPRGGRAGRDAALRDPAGRPGAAEEQAGPE